MIEHLHHAELYVNFKKCEFFKFKVEYLDFVIDKESIQMNSVCVIIIIIILQLRCMQSKTMTPA